MKLILSDVVTGDTVTIGGKTVTAKSNNTLDFVFQIATETKSVKKISLIELSEKKKYIFWPFIYTKKEVYVYEITIDDKQITDTFTSVETDFTLE